MCSCNSKLELSVVYKYYVGLWERWKDASVGLCFSFWLHFYLCVCACLCVKWKLDWMCESWSPCLELLALSLWAAVFPRSSMFSIVNEEDRRERGLLVLIYPGGSLGITINSQLLAHSTGLHRHCQFVPIREPSFWVSAVKGSSGRTGEQPARAWFWAWPRWVWLHLMMKH